MTIDTSGEAVERVAAMLDAWTADGVRGDAQQAAALLRALAAERDALNAVAEDARGDVAHALHQNAAAYDRGTADMREARSEAVPAAKFGEWQPIETAPHETDVVLFTPATKYARAMMEVAFASGGWSRNGISTRWQHAWATHWMPLPEPPK